ncbi:hypothetical protein M2408_002529 [Sphingobacterium sp. BIGb0165]|nr:hypothetical protein [Sphingobacterium sp. BIGb0165]
MATFYVVAIDKCRAKNGFQITFMFMKNPLEQSDQYFFR